MREIKAFINSFLRRDGLWVFLSTLMIKVSGVILSVAIVRLLPVDEYGSIAFAMSVISILTVFGGLGSNWSLLRFGPALPSYIKKYQMFRHTIEYGVVYTFPVIIIIIIGSFFLPPNLNNSQVYLIILSFSILTSFFYESLKSYFRIIGRNKIYSRSNVLGSYILLLLSIILSYFFGGRGYVAALVLAPFFSFLLFYKHIFHWRNKLTEINDKNYYSYGLYTGLGMIANQATISLGPIIAGYLNASSEDIALYKVATIIPFNLLIIPSMIMTTDFVHFSKNSEDPELLKKYYFQYFKTILIISIVPFCILLAFKKQILIILFGSVYVEATEMSSMMVVGVFFSFLFRTPLGNMLAAVGKAKWNIYHTLFWFIAVVPISILCYKYWGIKGITITVSFVFIFSGFISLIMFLIYLKKLKVIQARKQNNFGKCPKKQTL